MSNYPSVQVGKGNRTRVIGGLLFLSCMLLANGSLVFASETRSQLKITGDSIAGVLIKVPLHVVLEELREKLVIEFDVPQEERDKLISANLTGESVKKSLSKILSPWDYAFQVNGQGRVQQVFVVSKIFPTENLNTPVKIGEPQMAVLANREIQLSRKTPNSSGSISSPEFYYSPERIMETLSNFGEISESGVPMPIQETQGNPGNIQPSSSFMQVIPASGFPPMEILPVGEEMQREFIGGGN